MMNIIYESNDSYDNVTMEWVKDQFPELEEEIDTIISKAKDDIIVLEEESHSLLKFYF
jgi:hypothetical protein